MIIAILLSLVALASVIGAAKVHIEANRSLGGPSRVTRQLSRGDSRPFTYWSC